MQFRKLAILLHPDKNRFTCAMDGFVLIGDARTVLTDREKQMKYCNKCDPAGIPQANHQKEPIDANLLFPNRQAPQGSSSLKLAHKVHLRALLQKRQFRKMSAMRKQHIKYCQRLKTHLTVARGQSLDIKIK
ncbi:Hypothetical predicted protein [Olea europaea subsp. europaea]|uniref:J domain-containing protein n=1 Tax=Olea europaea subsp. europaea TaxID=158383 RepID=A0A8S0PJU3_OLEEU|nr:Hypothetical predicted protein [Olea europaea subsp. europaea]